MNEKAQHDLLVVISSLLFVILSTGREGTSSGLNEPVVIPSG